MKRKSVRAEPYDQLYNMKINPYMKDATPEENLGNGLLFALITYSMIITISMRFLSIEFCTTLPTGPPIESRSGYIRIFNQ